MKGSDWFAPAMSANNISWSCTCFVASHSIPKHQANCGLYSYVLFSWSFNIQVSRYFIRSYVQPQAILPFPRCSFSHSVLYHPHLPTIPANSLIVDLVFPPWLFSLKRTQIAFYMVLVWQLTVVVTRWYLKTGTEDIRDLQMLVKVPRSPCAWLPLQMLFWTSGELFCISDDLLSDEICIFPVLGSMSLSYSLQVENGGGRDSRFFTVRPGGPQYLGL